MQARKLCSYDSTIHFFVFIYFSYVMFLHQILNLFFFFSNASKQLASWKMKPDTKFQVDLAHCFGAGQVLTNKITPVECNVTESCYIMYIYIRIHSLMQRGFIIYYDVGSPLASIKTLIHTGFRSVLNRLFSSKMCWRSFNNDEGGDVVLTCCSKIYRRRQIILIIFLLV